MRSDAQICERTHAPQLKAAYDWGVADRRGRTAYLQSIELSNIRAIDHISLPIFKQNLLIGRNGTNKTTVLRAIAVSLASSRGAGAMLAQPSGSLIGQARDDAFVQATLRINGRTITTHRRIATTRDGEVLEWSDGVSDSRPLPVFAFGAARSVIGTDSSRYVELDDYAMVESLFDYRSALEDPELTLRRLADRLGDERYLSLLGHFKKLLDLSHSDELFVDRRRGGVYISSPDLAEPIPLRSWADGHRLTFAWLLDLFGKAMRSDALDDDGHVTGLLLVDELDQHLHPALQARVLGRLRSLLPRMQIIATSHSPLVALSARPNQLTVLRRTGATVEVDTSPKDFRGFTVEDMLADHELFDAPTMAIRDERLIARYEALLSTPRELRTEAEDRRLRQLSTTVAAQALPPDSESDLRRSMSIMAEELGLS